MLFFFFSEVLEYSGMYFYITDEKIILYEGQKSVIFEMTLKNIE